MQDKLCATTGRQLAYPPTLSHTMRGSFLLWLRAAMDRVWERLSKELANEWNAQRNKRGKFNRNKHLLRKTHNSQFVIVNVVVVVFF